MFDTLVVELPYPPSANRIWRVGKGAVYTSKEYENFKAEVAFALVDARAYYLNKFESYKVAIELHPADRRHRDVDNAVKPLFDAITKSGLVWKDDYQVVAFSVRKLEPSKKPYVRVTITSGDCL